MAENTEESTEKKKGGKKKLILLLVLVLLLAGGGFAGWKFFLQGDSSEQAENATAKKKSEEIGAPGPIVNLEPFVVNLADPMGRRYLKITMDVEATDDAAAAELQQVLPKIKDALLLLLSSKTFADISTMDQKIELKNDIIERLNLLVGKSKIKNVYFTEFVVQ